ncbi:hypothetical protein GCM10010522_20100 [Kribbella solani]
MRLGATSDGLLLASQGIAGDMENRNTAAAIVSHANIDKRTMLVLIMDDLNGTASTTGLRDRIIDKSMNIALLAPF